MEIKILVKEHQKRDLESFIKECEKQGFKITREGGGKLPNFSVYYAELKGERWQKADASENTLPIQNVSQQRELLIDFCQVYAEGNFDGADDETIVDWYLKVKDN